MHVRAGKKLSFGSENSDFRNQGVRKFSQVYHEFVDDEYEEENDDDENGFIMDPKSSTSTGPTLIYLINRYTSKCYYWEVIVLFRKMWLVAVGVLLLQTQQFVGDIVFGTSCFFFLLTHLVNKPFKTRAENLMETTSLVSLTILSLMELSSYGFVSDQTQFGEFISVSYNMHAIARDTLVVTLFIFFIVFGMIMVYFIIAKGYHMYGTRVLRRRKHTDMDKKQAMDGPLIPKTRGSDITSDDGVPKEENEENDANEENEDDEDDENDNLMEYNNELSNPAFSINGTTDMPEFITKK